MHAGVPPAAERQLSVPAPQGQLSVPALQGQLSVIVKCLNEERHLARCLRSIVAATADMDAEIIVVDSLSSDRSVEIALGFPVRVVQFARAADRRCGSAAQLGSQFAHGRFLLLIDGDMELLPAFLPAAFAALAADAGLAGIGAPYQEMTASLEFQERQRRVTAAPAGGGEVKRLNGIVLYRDEAIRAVGYLTNRNLYCAEELELGLRLRSAGWKLRVLPVVGARHYGHADAPLALLMKRWRSRYFHGYGQLLRGAFGRPYFASCVRSCNIFLLILGWWAALALSGVAAGLGAPVTIPLLLLPMPPVIALLRKRSLRRAAYTVLLWQFHAAALLHGLFLRQVDPRTPLNGVELSRHPRPV